MTTKPVNSSTSGTSAAAVFGAEANKAKSAAAKAPAGVREKPAGNYDVQISPDAKGRADAFTKALDIARATPDVRDDRVAALKKQIQDGTYELDSGNIADGLLREAIKDHLAETEER